MESLEVNVQSQKNKSQLDNAPIIVYRIIEAKIGRVTKTETIQIVPKAETEDDASNQSCDDNVNVALTTPFVINIDYEKQSLTSREIHQPVPILPKNNKSQNELSYAYVCDNGNEFFDPNLSCKVCSRSFKHSSHLKRHMNIHTGERVYKCDLCGKAFLDASTLSRHRKIHSGDKPWSCKICKKSFGTLGSLRRHITIHNQEGRPYQCETCKKRFPDYSSYQKHTFIHAGIKPHICDICSKAFVHIGDLNSHRKIHTEVKPYNCERCGKDFTKYSNYARHLHIHEGDKEFSCTICGVSYNFQSSLTRHLLTHVRKGNKSAAENLSESNLSKCTVQDEIFSEAEDASIQEINEPAPEETRKAVVLNVNDIKVTRSKMKHFSEVEYVNKLQGLIESEKYNSSSQSTEGSEQNPSEPQSKNELTFTLSEVSKSDCTILPPQDEFISKRKTENVTSLLTASDDCSSKEIAQTLPARLELASDMQSPEPLTALLTNNKNGFLLCKEPENLTNSDSFISSSDSFITIISITNEPDSLTEDVTNVESCTSVSDSDVVVVLGSSSLSTAESILPDISEDSDENEITKKLKSISYGVSSD